MSGTVVATFTYDPYGRPAGATGNIASPFGYGGQYTDAESGLIYLRARYYDPATGQFMSRDPLVAITQSAYGYAGDNPLNGTDPTGLYWGESLVHKILNIVAVPVYAEYYLPYQAAKAINKFGCSLGAVGCVISHVALALTPLPELEASGLGGDVALDWLKNKTTGNGESIYDEDIHGSILPRGWGGPNRFLPGLSKNSCGQVHVDFEW